MKPIIFKPRVASGPDAFILVRRTKNLEKTGPWISGFYAKYLKLTIDVILVIASLPFLFGVFFLLYFMVRQDGGPFLFRHQRVGRNGVLFGCLKIRTMAVDAEKKLQHVLKNDPLKAEEWRRTFKLRNDPRITGIGKKLRATGLDELPQLFNVLKGEMSLVGPRPITPPELKRYDESSASAYLMVRPGLTGPWQITSRRDNDFESRGAIDRDYVRTLSFSRDLKILLKTVPEVLHARGC